MSNLRTVIAWIARWLDDVALALTRFGGLFRPVRRMRVVEQPDGTFLVFSTRKRAGDRPIGEPIRIENGAIAGPLSARAQRLLSGSKIEILMQTSHFVFRPLELPRRAGEFLEGVVRAQIDRLTPWSPADAAFGWSQPAPVGSDRIVVTVAATARAMIAPIARAFGGMRADTITIATSGGGSGDQSPPIAVLTQQAGAEQRVRKLRFRLIAILGLAGAAVAGSVAAAIVIGADLDARQLDLSHRIAELRAALLSGRGSVADEALAALEARKRASPSGVIVMEALSQTLPDDTYLSELRIESGKVQIAGLTRDAPALIRLIEKSQHFTRATFFAPTTRAPTDNGDRFHIEAHVEPLFPAPQ
jgi:general secretion pathway protein L